MIRRLPYIALCGDPGAGKTTAADILARDYDTITVDDGEVLRRFAMDHMGATRAQVYSAEGKASLAYWPDGDPVIDARTGEHLTWRRVLGLLGNQLEAMFGTSVMPRIAVGKLDPEDEATYVFPSCRKDQGRYYKDRGGIVLGIDNPSVAGSGNDFDRIDESLVDAWVDNSWEARGLDADDGIEHLAGRLHSAIARLMTNDGDTDPEDAGYRDVGDPLSPACGLLNAALITAGALILGAAMVGIAL